MGVTVSLLLKNAQLCAPGPPGFGGVVIEEETVAYNIELFIQSDVNREVAIVERTASPPYGAASDTED